MAEIDYQMALLLQHKYEQEHKRKKLHKNDTESDYTLALALQEEGTSSKNHFTPTLTESDRELALKLQEDFKREADIERPANNLVYKPPKNPTNTKCLVDPSWEVIDPTPDIHVLFIAFNTKFFWSSLGSVTVSWSKKMTTCAGICSYQGHGGMCCITLSEPLLKLRPRKDLVETLLHEMIHAYLFVTNNNRDRDGHGPEFHKHMYRINAEAGTNITVYHDFHDEVNLYKQHWWRCDGPCQQRKPYYGMVRRAINRAPGPNDRWWADHQRMCGGTYIKVKEPEKPEKLAKPDRKKEAAKSSKNITPSKPENDIRNFLPVQNKQSSTNANDNKENNIDILKSFADGNPKPKPNYSIKPTTNPKSNYNVKPTTTPKPTVSTVNGISNQNSNSKITNVIPSKISNIHGFTNLSTPFSSSSSGNKTGNKKPGVGGLKGATKNAGGSTFVVNKKPSTVVKDDAEENKSSKSKSLNKIDTFNGTGQKLSSSKSTSEDDYSVVRNHWLNRFEKANKNNDNVVKNGIKRTNSTPVISSSKAPKLSTNETSKPKFDIDKSECPLCREIYPLRDLNAHLDNCLGLQDNNTKECIICGKDINVKDYELHVSKCCEDNFKDDEMFTDERERTCDKCNKTIKSEYYESHSKLCGDDILDLTKQSPLSSYKNSGNKSCPVCKLSLSEIQYNPHVEICLMKIFDDLEEKYDLKSNKKTSCLACGKEILKSELDSHLEDCMNMSNVFDTTNVMIIDDEQEDREGSVKENVNCPLCLQLVVEEDMQSHLDKCLNEVHTSKEAEVNKSIVLNSFIEEDDDFH